MIGLKTRLSLLVIILFAIIYALGTLLMYYGFGISGFLPQIIFAFGMMFFQYLIGPKLVEMMMRVRYVSKTEYPWLYEMVEDLSRKASLPMPRICISDVQVPNAFAFGRGRRDGRVCLTRGIMNLLDREELRAVLGHELSHLKNNDVLFITLLSVIPMVMYGIFRYFMWFGYGYRRDSRDSGGNYTALIGIAAFLFYFVSNLLILYASRIREFYADKGAVELGNKPSSLATALYKLVYGAAKSPKEEVAQVEGIKAFFLNDVSKARSEIEEVSALDMDRSGTIDAFELRRLREQRIHLRVTDKLMELLSTHPNMLKRIKQLSQYSNS